MMHVVYITGFGRSGSTVLDITLGRHPERLATEHPFLLGHQVVGNQLRKSEAIRSPQGPSR